MSNPTKGRIPAAAKGASLQEENITVEIVSLLFVLCTIFCKDAPKIQNTRTGRKRGAARTRQECILERVKFGRVIAFYMLFTRGQSAADADHSVTRTALSDSTPLT